MIADGRYLLLAPKGRGSVVCRLQKPGLRFQVTAMEKTDPQIHYVRDGYVPILLKNSIKMEDCFSAINQTIMNFS